MMTLPAGTSKHVVGASALLAALAILGYGATSLTERRTASLPDTGFAVAQQGAEEARWSADFLSQLNRLPSNAYGSARGPEASDSFGQKVKNAVTAILPSEKKTARADAGNWSEEDWRIAEQAVADHRGTQKGNVSASARSDIVWQPPEEIANRKQDQPQKSK